MDEISRHFADAAKRLQETMDRQVAASLLGTITTSDVEPPTLTLETLKAMKRRFLFDKKLAEIRRDGRPIYYRASEYVPKGDIVLIDPPHVFADFVDVLTAYSPLLVFHPDLVAAILEAGKDWDLRPLPTMEA